MSRPITLSESYIKEAVDEFERSLRKNKLSEGTIDYTKKLVYSNKHNAAVIFNEIAYMKMRRLIESQTQEIGWHATARRMDEEDGIMMYAVDDIFVHPQSVGAAETISDQQEFMDWQETLTDDEYNSMRFYGHSHVNIPVNPSSTDLNYQKEILSQIGEDDFYIFMICNKKYQYFIRIYDNMNNIMYETDDIIMLIGNNGFDIDSWYEKETKKVKAAKPAVLSGSSSKGGYTPYAYESMINHGYYDDDDDDDDLPFPLAKKGY